LLGPFWSREAFYRQKRQGGIVMGGPLYALISYLKNGKFREEDKEIFKKLPYLLSIFIIALVIYLIISRFL